MKMRAMALKGLEERVGEYVHLAEGGETILVTDRDRVLAELILPQRSMAPQGSLADAVQKGWIRPVASAIGTPPRIPVTSLSDLLQELQRDRSDR